MSNSRKVLTFSFTGWLATFVVMATAKKPANPVEIAGGMPALLWQDPADITTRDLFYGAGGRQHEPRGIFTFIEEDFNGTHPKIIVRDRQGIRWTVKLGTEAAPETAATRLVWAAGYFVNEDYFVRELEISDLPPRLHRGQDLISPGRVVRNVRLKRHLEGEKKIGNWRWRDNPFAGTREFNALRAMMALLNNWDLTDENNAIYKEPDGKQIYMVSDLGATFGTGRLTWPTRKNMGNLAAYKRSKFITGSTAETVDFHTPGPDSPVFIVTPREYFAKVPLRQIGKRVSAADARWLGNLLARLSPEQIQDAFRAAGYTDADVAGFSAVVEARIAALRRL